ncbi:MAG: hypothetical protein ACFFD2_01035 [Promethearchaeota archaeon]
MEVDWEKIEEKPDKPHKVEGYYLLNQRAKIEELEKNLLSERKVRQETEEKINDLAKRIEAQSTTLGQSIEVQGITIEEQKKQIQELENEKKNLLAKINELQEEFSIVKEENSKIEAQSEQITQIQQQLEEKENEKMQIIKENEELKQERKKLENKIEKLEGQKSELAATQYASTDLQQLLQQKDQKIQDLQNQLNQISTQSMPSQHVTQEPSTKTKQIETSEVAPTTPPTSASLLESESVQKPSGLPSTQVQSTEPSSKTSAVSGGKPGWKCPNCDASRVVEESNRSKILYIAAGRPIYAKKRRCLKCSYEWEV